MCWRGGSATLDRTNGEPKTLWSSVQNLMGPLEVDGGGSITLDRADGELEALRSLVETSMGKLLVGSLGDGDGSVVLPLEHADSDSMVLRTLVQNRMDKLLVPIEVVIPEDSLHGAMVSKDLVLASFLKPFSQFPSSDSTSRCKSQ